MSDAPDEFPRCMTCNRVIPEGEVFTAISLSREYVDPASGVVNVLDSYYQRIACSQCDTFRSCQERISPTAENEPS